jgi:hypothetical protein
MLGKVGAVAQAVVAVVFVGFQIGHVVVRV